jgi:peptidyl-prolyl cis-trans isomerase C
MAGWLSELLFITNLPQKTFSRSSISDRDVSCRYFINSLAPLQRLHFWNLFQNMLNKQLSGTPALTMEKGKNLTYLAFVEIIRLSALDKGLFCVLGPAKGCIMRTCFLSLRIIACCAILSAVFSLSCRPKSPEETDADKPTPDATAESDADKIAVTVNGVDVTESEIEELIKPRLEMMARQASQLPPAFAEQREKELRQQALEQLISRQLLDERVKSENIVVSEEEVISALAKMLSAQEPLSLDDLKKQIESRGQSFDEIKQQTQKGLAYQKVMEAQWAGKINVTEDDAKKYYDENPKRFETPEQIRASHILIKPVFTDPNVDPNADPNEAKAKARAKTQDLLKQIKGGADFAELAKAHSTCPLAPKGGDLGFFPRGQATLPFEKAAFELEVGQISDIVETEYGYHIIKVTDHKDAGVTSFEQAKDNIIEQLTREKQSEFASKYIESLKAAANIVYPSEE